MNTSTTRVASQPGFRNRRPVAAALALAFLLGFAPWSLRGTAQDVSAPPKKAKKKGKTTVNFVPGDKIHTLRHTATELPGVATLGTCVNAWTGTLYPLGNQGKPLGADLLDRHKKETTSIKLTSPKIAKYTVPDFVSVVTKGGLGDVSITLEDSLTNTSTKLAASVGVEASVGMFSTSLNASYEKDEARSESKKFAYAKDVYQFYSVQLKDAETTRTYLQTDMKALIDGNMVDGKETVPPQAVIDKLGTHYVRSVIVGGQCIRAITLDTTSYQSETTVEVAIKASCDLGFTSVSSETRTKNETAIAAVTASSTRNITLIGGDESLTDDILHENYQAWLRSVKQTPVVCAYPTNGLGPLWELASDPARQDVLKTAINDYLNTNGAKTFPAKFPLRDGDVIGIRAVNGQWITPADKDIDVNLYANKTTIVGAQPFTVGAPKFLRFTIGTNQLMELQMVGAPQYMMRPPTIMIKDKPAAGLFYLTAWPVGGGWKKANEPLYIGYANAGVTFGGLRDFGPECCTFEIQDAGSGMQLIYNSFRAQYWSFGKDGVLTRSANKDRAAQFKIFIFKPAKP